LVEHTAENRGVAGSIPALATSREEVRPAARALMTSSRSVQFRPLVADAGKAGIGERALQGI
jgi:hypothetical protein